jgi:GH18 family chitinase
MRRTDGTKIISYDDPSSVGLKCQYVKDKTSAGVIIWELGGDFRSGNSDLLEVIGRSFGVD